MGRSIDVAHDPSVADYRATSPRYAQGGVFSSRSVSALGFGRLSDMAVLRREKSYCGARPAVCNAVFHTASWSFM